jgi:two-component system, OmpR family, response regulator
MDFMARGSRGVTPEQTRILVADDEGDIRDLLTFKLGQAGYTVQAVGNGTQALAAIEADPPDLAVLDFMMPGLSGIDVLRKIREDGRLSGVRVILLTARARDADVDAGFVTGADDYIIKPFSPRELLHRVNTVLARPRS